MDNLRINLSDGEVFTENLNTRELSASPKVIISRAKTSRGVIFNFTQDENGNVNISSNYGFKSSSDGLTTKFDEPNPNFVDKF